MADQQHLDILKQGVEVWNKWRQENPEVQPDLSDADLSSIELISLITRKFTFGYDPSFYNASIIGIDFTGANLARANLSNTKMMGADLKAANLAEALLIDALLVNADLSGATLSRAKLTKANLSSAALMGANLREADLTDAKLYNADLRLSNLEMANLTKSWLSDADLTDTNFSRAILNNANLTGANFVRTILTGANLTDCRVYGISVWDIHLEDAKQLNLVITPDDQPIITVDNLEVAQFIYLLLTNQKIRDVITTLTTKAVLILGRFTEERKKVLDTLRDELRTQNYSPMVFNFEGADNKDFTATVRTLANMVRFVLLDLTDLDETIHEIADEIVPHCFVPLRPLLLQGSHGQGYGLFRERGRIYRWVLAPYRYKDVPDLQSSFQAKILQPIHEKIIELKQRKSLKMFIGYASEDESMLIELKKHLILLEWSGQIQMWDDREIKPGEEREDEIERHISEAFIILLLLSPDFIVSNDCQAIQERALERFEQGEASLIPILLRPCSWQSTPLKGLQLLPRDGKPISQQSKDDIFLAVSQEIAKVVKSLCKLQNSMS